MLGISESNIKLSTDYAEVRIECYNLVRTEGEIGRLYVYHKENLKIKILENKKGNVAALWIEVGDRRNKCVRRLV